MDTIIKVILWILAAWFAYAATSSERRVRTWSPFTTIGVYLALFGATTYGLLQVESYFTAKLTDTYPSDNDLLIGGLIVLAAVIVLALDLLGKVDLMGKVRETMSKSDMGRSAPGGGAPTGGTPTSGTPTGDD